MSLLETNKPSIQNPKDLTNNIVDSSNPINDIASGASKISKPLHEEVPRYTLIPAEELEKKAKAKALSYGGIKDLIGSHIVYATVKVAGEDILKSTNFSFTLNQKVANHHEFDIICSADEFNEQNNYPLENSQKLLGKRISIFLHQFSEVTFSFTGIITGLTNRKMNGYSKVILSGQSPTILLENGKDCLSYENKNLADIIKTATTEYPSDLIQWDIRPRFQDVLLYTVQYKESDFDFIKRLTTRYGEWFYYDGEQINIGGYGGKMTEILETQDFFEFELKMKLIPQKFSYVSYDAKQAKNHTVDSESITLQSPTNPYLLSALEASEEVYSKTPLSLYNHTLMESGEAELRSAITREKQKRQNAVYLEAKSNNPNLNLGDLVKMNAWVPDFKSGSTKEAPLETYRIIEIKHSYESTKGYSNEFIGVPKDNFGPPYTDEDAMPICEEQSATVSDNKDPQQMGRIRVQFAWQEQSNQQSPWIRLIQPHAGGGKGFYFLPEIGEEVLVSFKNQNAEKPYVLGTQYNGKETSGYYTDGNDNKVIQTRSGTKIVMNDTEGSIFIEDPSGNTYLMDGQGNIKVNAPENMDFTIGKDLNIQVGNNMNTSVGNNNNLEVNQKHSLTSQNYNQVIYQNKKVNINGDLSETTSTSTYKIVGGDFWVQSTGISTIVGAIDAKVNKG